MPFLSTILNGIDSIKGSITGSIMSSLTKKYPEMDQLLPIIDMMKTEYYEECIKLGIGKDEDEDGVLDDTRYVPSLLTLGLIYKIQQNDAKKWYNAPDSVLENSELQVGLLHTFGYFWHILVAISLGLRSKDDGSAYEEGNKLKETLLNFIPSEDVIFGYSDNHEMESHCPDFALTIHRNIQKVVLTVCGTQMFPAPEMKDVFMDLYADSEPFLHGHAHKGMVIGAKNIIEKIMDKLVEVLVDNPGYGLMITGYSLGAGVSQLVALELLEGPSKDRIPEGVVIYGISYGTPPIFKSDEYPGYKNPALFSVIYHNDGLVSASITNVLKLLMQIKAIENTELRRRDMLILLFSKTEEEPIEEEGEDDEISDTERSEDELGNTNSELRAALWDEVRAALESVEHIDDFVHLEHISQVFIFKKKDEIVTRIFRDTNQFTSCLRLKPSMLNHHMPWGYDLLFEEYGKTDENVSIDYLEEIS